MWNNIKAFFAPITPVHKDQLTLGLTKIETRIAELHAKRASWTGKEINELVYLHKTRTNIRTLLVADEDNTDSQTW